MAINDSPHIGQTKSDPFEFIGAMESMKQAEELFRMANVKTRSIIFYEKSKVMARFISPADLNARRIFVAGVFEGVFNQIHPDLAQQRGIAMHRGQRWHNPFNPPPRLL